MIVLPPWGLFLFIGVISALYTQFPLGSSNEVPYRNTLHGGVASENQACSQIGTDLLIAGGNAADAIVGTTFCVGVLSPYHSGIGGGGFALIRAPNGSYEALDFRETAPAAAHEDMFLGNVQGSLYGGLASGVPGELRGLEYIHTTYGKLSWSNVLAPAIRLARYGFPVSYDLVRGMDSASRKNDFLTHNDFLTKDPTWAMDFAPNGPRLGAGEIMTRKRYANTLETIATHGADAFYTGLLANLTIQTIQRENGTMTMDDLANYRVISRPAVSIDYQDDYRLFSCGSPASGAIALSILQTISGYNCRSSASSSSSKERDSSLNAHRLAEAMRFSYGQRTLLGDPSFLPNISLLETHLLSSEYGSSTRARILDITTQNISAYNPSNLKIRNSHGTSHISAGDSSGLAISLTTTVNLYFGSKVMIPESGVIMNNQMNDFSIPGATNAFGYRASPANYVRPGKRGLSSVAPVIIEKRRKEKKGKGGKGSDGTGMEEENEWGLYAVLGAAGGSRIITAVVQNVIDLLSPALSPSSASGPSSPSSSSCHPPFLSPDPSFLKDVLASPRIHDQLLPNILKMEKGGWGDDPSLSSTPDSQQVDQSVQQDSFREANNNSNASAIALARALENKGHVVEWTERGYSACQAVLFSEEEDDKSPAADEDIAMRTKRGSPGGLEGEGRGMKGRWFAEGDPRQRDSGGSTV